MFKKIIYIAILIYASIFSSCSKNENADNNLNTNDINTNSLQSNNYSNDFFDMKYVYKSIRVDKEAFSNALLSYYQDPNYSNIINRNKDFLNRKLVGDNDIKKYAIDYISNTYHNRYSDSVHDDNSVFSYASEYNYVEQNLALKKARELLFSIKNKDADIYLALFLSHFAADSLYNFHDIQSYLKEWKKLGATNIDMMIGIVGEGNNVNNIYSNKMKLINYIIEAPSDLGAEKLIADAYENGFLSDISKDTGYLDIYNENNYNLSSVIYNNTSNISYFTSAKDIVNTNIIDKYIRTYTGKTLSRDKMISPVYYENFYYTYNPSLDKKYEDFADLYFLEFNKNTFIYSIKGNKLKSIYYLNPMFIDNIKYADYEIGEIFNFHLGDDSKLESAKISAIKTADLKNIASNSQFILDGKFIKDKYIEYLDDILSFPIYNPEFFLCDINNDGKDEIMVRGTYEHSGERSGIASYTLLLKDDLELNLESTIGKSINGSSKQGLNNIQRMYLEDGKNKILLIDPLANTAQDIFAENGVVNVYEFTYKTYKYEPRLVWKGKIINGVPDGVLKTDASFDMYKAESDSDRAIVSDKTLRMADKLISYGYYKEAQGLDKDKQDELLEKRRSDMKSIQDKYGDVLEIESEMMKILGIDK
ncbi:hypothetical protein [Brachyspira hampsonii]|uniref:Uncharacterized protein n=1 Tax=Brachyspira hampsonii TaxID=1287055 RepID=A0AAC9TR67_9SPIR|nr:hypothetical protein [Brachyspira hampsonii]ASJ20350.1 hypothetical protein BHAMNSH16_01205 [Brachyspira hampsonii]ELV05333.1 hypothetical protein H263_10875 [Brachyspira hampsonii 30599]MBW5379136.1 hypothetical protein [Brachyspira hampsonii]OEJ16325.1 hypothetical protein A9496_01230 [Brachyspira hampsonii]